MPSDVSSDDNQSMASNASSIALPPDVIDGSDDDAWSMPECLPDVDTGVLDGSASECDIVNSPTLALVCASSQREHLAEYFSPPRLAPKAREYGLIASLSLDLTTNWNLAQPKFQEAAYLALSKRPIEFLMLSPPCSCFSPLMEL